MHEAIEQKLLDRILWAWNVGCPVATDSPESAREMAALARRRWNSVARRRHGAADTDRIRDLANGLADCIEAGGRRGAGALTMDYMWLAGQLADVLSAESANDA